MGLFSETMFLYDLFSSCRKKTVEVPTKRTDVDHGANVSDRMAQRAIDLGTVVGSISDLTVNRFVGASQAGNCITKYTIPWMDVD